jgi:hypothetical protein
MQMAEKFKWTFLKWFGDVYALWKAIVYAIVIFLVKPWTFETMEIKLENFTLESTWHCSLHLMIADTRKSIEIQIEKSLLDLLWSSIFQFKLTIVALFK